MQLSSVFSNVSKFSPYNIILLHSLMAWQTSSVSVFIFVTNPPVGREHNNGPTLPHEADRLGQCGVHGTRQTLPHLLRHPRILLSGSTTWKQVSTYVFDSKPTYRSAISYTVEPPNKGHYGTVYFVPCREGVPIGKNNTLKHGVETSVPCREGVPIGKNNTLKHGVETSVPCREGVPIGKNNTLKHGVETSVPCREVVPILEVTKVLVKQVSLVERSSLSWR